MLPKNTSVWTERTDGVWKGFSTQAHSFRDSHPMSARFHDLRVAEVRRETADCVSIVLDVPADLSEAFAFKQGQYLTFDQEIQGEAVRRSYSICAGVGEELRVAVKRVPEGRFSTWANGELKAGDTLKTMPPNGRFYTELDLSLIHI